MKTQIEIGQACRAYRMNENITLKTVGLEVGCSKENVAAFEKGRNDNGNILLWYILHGIDLRELI